MAKQLRKMKITSKDRIIGTIAVLAVALAARLIYLNAASSMSTFTYLTFDLLHFHNIAVAIFHGAPLGHEAVFKAPLYSMVLAQIYGLMSNPVFNALLFQCFLGSLSSALVYLIAADFYSQKIAFTAGLTAALYGTLIYFDSELLPVSLTVSLVLASLYLLVKFEDSRRILLVAGAGIALALAGAATPETLILVPVALWWVYRDSSGQWKARVISGAILLATVVLVTLPFALRNNSTGGEKIPYLTDIGVRMAIANQAGADGRTFTLPNSSPESGQNYVNTLDATDRASGRELPQPEMGGFWLRRAFGDMAGSPIAWLGLEMRKLVCAISGYEISTDRPIYFIAAERFPLSVLLFDKLIFFPFGLILPLVLLAPLATSSSRRKQHLLIWSLIALVAVTLMFNVFAYQRILFVPILIVWAAAGFWGLIELYQRQDFRRFYIWLPMLLVAIIIVNGVARVPGLVPRIDSEFEGRMFEANALLAANRIDDARATYEKALRLDPRSARPYSSIANTYSQQGEDSLAVVYYNRALSVNPGDDRPLRGIAGILKRQQKIGELSQILVSVMRQFPKANWAYAEYANIHIRLGEYTQAADIYERSFQADSTDYGSIFLKGETYLTADMRQEAETEFLRYLQYAPNSIPAHANLGQIYARQRRTDEARREFEYVRNQQPSNPASYFNLASIYYQIDDLQRSSSYLDTARALDRTFPGLDEMRGMIDSARVKQ